jgi:two-component system chemotaxis sensor kinase CheA
MIDDQALLSEYLSESEELLESLLADLDSLASRATSSPDINLINRIFRTAHSLKGLSSMMGLGEVQALAHEFEDILDDLRLGNLSLNPTSAAVLQEAGAGLAALVGSAARGLASADDFERLSGLLASIIARSRTGVREGEAASRSLTFSSRERGLLTEYEEHRIAENLKAGRSFYAIAAEFEVASLDKDYRRLASSLSENGEVITTLPGSGANGTGASLKLVFATRLKEAEIKRLVAPIKARVSRLERTGWRRAGDALRVVGLKRPSRSEAPGAVLPPAFAQESLKQLSPNVRVDMSQIDELSGLAHELSIQTERLAKMSERFLNAAGLGAREGFDLKFISRRIERDFIELEERLVSLRMVSLAQTFTRAARLAGRLARELGKSVSVELIGRDTQLDKVIVDRVADSIYHLLRNAIDHGLESSEQRRLAGKSARGKIKIEAALEGTRAVISITDDGRGVDVEEVRRRAIACGLISEDYQLSQNEILAFVFSPGLSTADHVSAVSGRGVGLDAVERTIHDLGGEVRVASEPGKWARFEIAVPTTLVMISAFIVTAGEWSYAINVNQILELRFVAPDDILGRDGRRSIVWKGSNIPLVELRYLLGLGGARVLQSNGNGNSGQRPANESGRVPLLITKAADRTVAVAVEAFQKQREIIVKSLGSIGGQIKGVVGGVDLEGGEVALVLDLPSLLIRRSIRM